MVSFNLICVIFNFDCSDGFDSDDSFDSYPPFPLLLKQDTPDFFVMFSPLPLPPTPIPQLSFSNSTLISILLGEPRFGSKLSNSSLGLGIDFTFAWDKNNNNNNKLGLNRAKFNLSWDWTLL